MSRIGKKPVDLPAGVTAKVEGQKVTIKGATGAVVDGGGSKIDLSPAAAKVVSSGITEIKGSLVKLN